MTFLRTLAAIATAAAGVALVRHARHAARAAGRRSTLTPEDRRWLHAWVAEEIKRLRALTYSELVLYQARHLHCAGLTPSGLPVMRETRVFWDDPRQGALRVFIDTFEPRAGQMPPSIAKDDFIRASNGSFIDE